MPKVPQQQAQQKTGSSSENRKRLEDMGFTFVNPDAFDALGDQYTQDIADAFEEMEAKYGAIGAAVQDRGQSIKFVVEKDDAFAWVTRDDRGRVYKVGVSSSRTYEQVNESYQKHMGDGWFTTSTRSGANATMVHEYGHIMHNAMTFRFGGGKSVGQFTAGAKRSIMSIGKKKYGAQASDVSKYGLKNGREFFAEAFLSANGGSPNSIGLAFGDWMGQKFAGF